MKTSFEIDKIKAVVLYILGKSDGTLDHIALFKRMYFAQQLYLVRYGRVIFNDSFRGFKKGPVPTFTYKSFLSALDNLTNATVDIAANSGYSKNMIFPKNNVFHNMRRYRSSGIYLFSENLAGVTRLEGVAYSVRLVKDAN